MVVTGYDISNCLLHLIPSSTTKELYWMRKI
jgi:hypothetical protein